MSTEDRIYARVSSQVSLTVYGNNIFRKLQKRVLEWASDPERNLGAIPKSAWDGETFVIDRENSERAAARKLESPKYWAFRLIEGLKDKDTNRTWTTEVGIDERHSNQVIFGCRVMCSQRGLQDIIPRSIPRFVRDIAFEQKVTLDGRVTSAKPWIIDNKDAVDRLVLFLQSADRNHPVVLFALPEYDSDLNETSIPVDLFIRRTVGYVHTAIITSVASFALMDRLGREFSVYRGAVRTYNPRFDPDSDHPTDHPVASAARIQEWQYTEESPFIEFLVRQTLRLTRPRRDLERELPSFQTIERIAAKKSRDNAKKAGQSDAELLELSQDEALAAQKDVKEYADLLAIAEQELDRSRSNVQNLLETRFHLSQRIENLKKQLRESGQTTTLEIPSSLDGFENWCQENLLGFVTLHPRAFQAVKKSKYEDVGLIYEALILLRDFYVPMKREGGKERKDSFDDKCRKLGIKEDPTFSGTRWGEQGDTYIVRYGAQRCLLERHLKKGNEHNNEQRCFRLYFFWQEEEQMVVVGWLPSHLATRIT